jgi:hypothetical protein
MLGLFRAGTESHTNSSPTPGNPPESLGGVSSSIISKGGLGMIIALFWASTSHILKSNAVASVLGRSRASVRPSVFFCQTAVLEQYQES